MLKFDKILCKPFGSGGKRGNFRVRRPVCLVLAVLVAALPLLSACGGDSGGESAGGAALDLPMLYEMMAEVDANLPEMKRVDDTDKNAELNFSALCDYEYDGVQAYVHGFAKDGSAAEIALVQLKDSTDEALLMSSLKKHVEKRKATMEEYSPEQVAMVENYVLTRRDGVVALIISPGCGVVEKAFKEYQVKEE